METHNAVYYKKCHDKIGKKPCSGANSSSSTVIPHKRTKTELGKELCRRVHSGSNANDQHVQKLTESWREMALATGNLDVHAKLGVGDVRSNEIFYHKNHLSQFHNRYRASQAKKDDGTDQRKKVLLQTYEWRQISNYIQQSDEQFTVANVLRKNMPHSCMHTISHTHHIVHGF